MQGLRKTSVTSSVFDDVFVDADGLGALSGEQRAKLDRVVNDAIREATRRLERMHSGASRYIMKERIDFPIDLEREPGALTKELAQAIVARIEVRLGMRISDTASSPTVPSSDSLSLGLAEPRRGSKAGAGDELNKAVPGAVERPKEAETQTASRPASKPNAQQREAAAQDEQDDDDAAI